MKKSEDLQDKYIEFQLINQQIAQLQQQILSLSTQLIELKSLKDNLENFKKLKKGTESLVPLGANIFTKMELKENEEVIVNVGSNVLVKKSVPESQKIIDKQLKELESLIEQFQDNLEKIASRAQELQKDLIKATEKQ